MIKGSVLFTGQYVFGATAGAPLISSATGQLASGVYSNEVNSSSALAIGAGTTVIGGCTVTPAAGTYLVMFSCNITAASAGGNKLTIELYVGGAGQADTVRTAIPLSSAALAVFQNMSISTNKIVTVNGSQAIALEGGSSAGTVTITGLNFDVVRIA